MYIKPHDSVLPAVAFSDGATRCAIPEEGRRYERLVEFSVVEQCINVIKTATVQQSYLAGGYPLVHGWEFDLRSGLITDLRINFEVQLKAIQEIYNLTGTPWFRPEKPAPA